jgi:tetratricopeptide (TPR) repeat protein
VKIRLIRIAFILITSSCVSAASPPDWQTLLRQGDAAYGRGDYTTAAALYEQAGDRTTDPGLVAFDLAAAQYRLALASDANRVRLAREAEQSYRCCIKPRDPRRARGLYGLGNALMLRAGDRDVEALKAAVESYQQCLAETNVDEELTDDAQHNLERARLLLLQIPPPSAAHSKDESAGDVPPKPQTTPRETPGARKNPTHDPSTGVGKPDKSGDPTKLEKGTMPAETDAPPQPGSGNLPPVPDRADLPPLSAEDAARHLELASLRIEEDYKVHRRSKAPAPMANVRDW